MSHPCPKCKTEMEFQEADPGEPPSLAEPFGGAPPVPAYWSCPECEHTENDDEDRPTSLYQRMKKAFSEDAG